MIKSSLQQHYRYAILTLLGLLLMLSASPSYAQSRPDPTPAAQEAAPNPNQQYTPDNPDDAQNKRPQDDSSQQPSAENSDNSAYNALPVPFGLQWGQGPEEIMEWAASREFQTAWKAQAQGTESVLNITPPPGVDQFPNAEFNDLNFAFKNGHLVEVKVTFRYTDQNPTQTEAIAQNRKTLVEKDQNQEGHLIQNNHNKKDGVQYQNRLWQWEKGPGLYIYMTASEARNKQKNLLSVALIYRNQTLAVSLPNQPR